MVFYPNSDKRPTADYIPPTTTTDKEFDRHTALQVLKDLSSNMHCSRNLYGQDTLVIHRDKFEEIRAKWLDKRENKK